MERKQLSFQEVIGIKSKETLFGTAAGYTVSVIDHGEIVR